MADKISRTDVVVTEMLISRQGSQQYFSLSLPDDVIRIVGVETGITLVTAIPNLKAQTAGTIRLQATERPNTCFCGDVKTGKAVIEGLTPGFAANSGLLSWASLPFVAGTAYEPEKLHIPASRSLYGCYTDELGKNLNQDLLYTVRLFLWIDVMTYRRKNEHRAGYRLHQAKSAGIGLGGRVFHKNAAPHPATF